MLDPVLKVTSVLRLRPRLPSPRLLPPALCTWPLPAVSVSLELPKLQGFPPENGSTFYIWQCSNYAICYLQWEKQTAWTEKRYFSQRLLFFSWNCWEHEGYTRSSYLLFYKVLYLKQLYRKDVSLWKRHMCWVVLFSVWASGNAGLIATQDQIIPTMDRALDVLKLISRCYCLLCQC